MATYEASCDVFIRDKDILVASSARTIPGFDIIVDPVFKLARNEPATAVGKAVLEALRAYRVGVPAPGPDMGKMPNPLLKLAGCRSWGQLDRASINVLINLCADYVLAIPTHKELNRGFSHLNELAVKCDLTARAIGDAVMNAASRCT